VLHGYGEKGKTLAASGSIGRTPDDYDVLENGVVVGRIFLMPIGLNGRRWTWMIHDHKGHTGTRL